MSQGRATYSMIFDNYSEVDLPGHKGNVKSQFEGNVQSSGHYVSLVVVDKLMGDKLIQKVTLGRSDSQK
jgi:translation elongation factor EF-G